MPKLLYTLPHATTDIGFHPGVIIQAENLSPTLARTPSGVFRHSRRWSDAETALLQELYPTSEAILSIADRLRQLTENADPRSKGSIYAKARRLALKRPPRSATTVDEVANREVVPAPAIVLPAPNPHPVTKSERSKINGVRRTWRSEVCERAERLWSANFHPATIAHVLGPTFTASSVSSKAHRLGFPRRLDWRKLSKNYDRACRIDREAAPLPTAMPDLFGYMVTRKRCSLTGNAFYGRKTERYSPQAKETKWWRNNAHCC